MSSTVRDAGVARSGEYLPPHAPSGDFPSGERPPIDKGAGEDLVTPGIARTRRALDGVAPASLTEYRPLPSLRSPHLIVACGSGDQVLIVRGRRDESGCRSESTSQRRILDVDDARTSNSAGGACVRRPDRTVAAHEGISICRTREEDAMPTPRGSVVFSDLIDCHGESLVCLIRAAEDVTSDGIVEPHERLLLSNVITLVRQTYEPLPVGAAEQDDAFRAIGAIAGAGRVTTRHVRSLVSQAGTDAERRIA